MPMYSVANFKMQILSYSAYFLWKFAVRSFELPLLAVMGNHGKSEKFREYE
jgi:hypothetical protein